MNKMQCQCAEIKAYIPRKCRFYGHITSYYKTQMGHHEDNKDGRGQKNRTVTMFDQGSVYILPFMALCSPVFAYRCCSLTPISQ